MNKNEVLNWSSNARENSVGGIEIQYKIFIDNEINYQCTITA